jgi:hypothetical protein
MSLNDLDGFANVQYDTIETVQWDTATDWDNAVSEAGVVHESYGDLEGADVFQLGYPSYDRGGSNLVAFWSFDDDSSPITDHTGNGWDATVNGPSYDSGAGLHNSDSWNWDGGNDWMNAGDIDALSNSGEFTICGWMNTNTGGGDDRDPLYVKETVVEIVLGDSSIGLFGYIGDGSSWGNQLSDGTDHRDGSYHHVAGTYNDSTDTFALYLDGTKTAENTSYGQSIGSNNTDVEIGARQFESDWYANDNIEYLRVYDRELSDSEVQGLANAGTQGSLTTGTKSLLTPSQPSLNNLDYSLNGETITLDVIGSPGTADEETVSQTLDGSSSYTLSWSDTHTDFRVTANLSSSAVTETPVMRTIGLQA